MPMKKSAIEKLLRQPNIAVVAVTAPNGAPHAVPTWYEYNKGEVVFHTGPEAFKYKCLQKNPRVTLVVDTRKPPYKCVILKGKVTMTEGTDDDRVKRMSIEYLGKKDGKAYAKTLKGEKLIIVRFKPERTISWDYSEESPS
jgi:uncharacterized protein